MGRMFESLHACHLFKHLEGSTICAGLASSATEVARNLQRQLIEVRLVKAGLKS